MKRLLVRLSLISMLVAVGAFAIAQSQRERAQGDAGEASPEAPDLSPQVPLQTPHPVAHAEDNGGTAPATASPALSSLIPLPAQLRETGRSAPYVMPAPSPVIVRGNNPNDEEPGEDEAPLRETVSESATAGVAAPSQPAANHLAQNDGLSARPRNPFARRASMDEAGEYRISSAPQDAGLQDAGGSQFTAPSAAPAATGEDDFRPSGPTPASPAPAAEMETGAADAYQEYTPSAGNEGGAAPASNDAANSAGAPSAAQAPTLAAPQLDASPSSAALGAPRELTPYGGATDDLRPLAGSRADDRSQEFAAPVAAPIQTPEAAAQEPSYAPARERSGSLPAGAPATLGAGGSGYGASAMSGVGGMSGAVAAGVEGVGTPGPQELEGAQTPSLTLKKIAPPEIQVGKAATFEIDVRNVGQVAAHQVIVKEEIPRGVRLIDAAPPATPQGGSLLWELGTLQAGESRQIKIQYLPVAEGDVGSVAVAAFQAQASVRTVCTRPQLTVEQSAPEKVLLGQSFTVRIRLANPGTGVANRVVLEEDVPDGFIHPSGKALEYEVGALRPGESRDLDLTLQAARPGVWNNLLVVRGEGNLAVEHAVKVEIVAPQLELAMTGPTRRYLERQATYTVAVANPGTATANDVTLVSRLPKGMKFVAATNEGQYDPKTHVVQWSLAELPPGQVGQVQLTAVPVETGEQKLTVEGKGDLDISAQTEHAVAVEALAELAFEISDQGDPIEVNKETIYEVKVTNKGSKTATNVRVSAVFPPDMKPLAGDGPARAEVAGNRVLFEPLARLNPREQAIFRVQAQGLRPGDQRVQIQVVSDDSPTPVTKEESTRIYADR